MGKETKIDVGAPGAWKTEGLLKLDAEVSRLARHHADTDHGAESIRWFFLDTVLQDPVAPPFATFERMLQDAENSLASLVFWRIRNSKGHLNDGEVGTVLGYSSGAPVFRREWRELREKVFDRIGLEFGPPPATGAEKAASFDIGDAPEWRYDVIRALDGPLTEMARHHAETDVSARTIRWFIWHELTARPRPIELAGIEEQLEQAEESLMASFGDHFRKSPGHLHDEEVAKMLRFRNKRPVEEGYYRILREEVFGRIAGGFGAVDMPELPAGKDALDVGRQGRWKVDNLKRVDERIGQMARAYARSEDGAQALRWHLLDQITGEPGPVDLALLEQRLHKLGASVLDLFGVFQRRRKDRPFLSDAKIARYAGFSAKEEIPGGRWKENRERVQERVDLDGVFEE